MNAAYIGLGSNVGDRLAHLKSGKDALAQGMEITSISPVYETEPIGTGSGGTFLNAVVGGCTELAPEELLELCLHIEQESGRMRTTKNAPRTLDLDLLLHGDWVLESEHLILPHPRMHERAFVLIPLADIAPSYIHPTLNLSVQQLLDRQGDTRALVHSTTYEL